MPNKYEREIEEILRNLEQTEPKGGRGQRSGGRSRLRAERRMNVPQRHFPSLNFSFGATEWSLIACIIAALIAGGFAYVQREGNIFTGVLAIISALCLLFVALSPFVLRRHYSTQSTRYGNVTPLRRNPLSGLATRWHLFLLKLRYRRRRGL